MQDFEYFKSMYPAEAKRLQRFVDIVLDEMEYEGSPIYDEYPDRILLEQMLRKAVILIETQGTPVMPQMAEEIRQAAPERTETTEIKGRQPSGRREVRVPCGPLYLQIMETRRPWEPNQQSPERPPVPLPGPVPWRPPLPPGSGPWRPPLPPGSGPWRPPTPPGSGPWGPPMPPRQPSNQRDLLTVLLLHELQGRRCRNGICR